MTKFGPIEFPKVPPGEPVTLSATAYVAFERCPEQAAGRLRGVYGPESRASFVGGLAHRVFARHLSGGPIAEAEFPAACREEIGTSMNAKLAGLGLRPSQLAEVVDEVGRLYERFKTMGIDGFVGAEVMLEAEPSPGVVLRGSVDAVFEDEAGVRLVDWKTAGLGDPVPQLSFYALLWTMARGDMPGRVEALSVGSGERIDEVPTAAGLQETAGRVAHMASEVRRIWSQGGSLERIAGPWCRWCPLLAECSEGASAGAILGD